ncbi:MAG: cation-translocating P-type ATPase [Methanobacteriaceae archaeon]|nr:cation-translocating P-type ATPase [Methanobacteriaceae archaeon]
MIQKTMQILEGLPMTIISGIFLLISLIFMFFGIKTPIDSAWITIIISGIPLLYLAISRLIYEKWISSALLICMAMIASIMIGQIFAAGEVVFIMALGALLEEYTVNRSKKGLSDLINLKPEKGRLLITKQNKLIEKEIDAKEIKIGDKIRVLPGEKIPVDGIIIHGDTSVDQSIMTGESLPLDKTVNDEVFSGTINCYGSIDIQATKTGKNTSLEKLIRMVKDAENNQAPTQRIADKWATWLVPIALGIAIATYFITGELIRAVTILVVFCPCALILATPTAIMAAIGQATKQGVLIKSGEALEKMGNINCITFDKTGTLTYGQLEVSDIVLLDKNITKKELMQYTTISEIKSEHPLGKAIIKYSKENNIPLEEPKKFEMIPGKGVKATYQDNEIISGNVKLLSENNITVPNSINKELEILRNEGKASILISYNQKIIGIIGLSDVLRENAGNVITKLYQMDTTVELLTGDNKQTAKYFADKIGIKNVHAELLPEDKVRKIKELQKEDKKICMIGDGINDAPALKTAEVSVAMGTMGSDIAIEAADIALLSDDIEKIPYLKKLSNATLQTIHISITISMIINAVAIILSVLGILDPISGALVHNIGSVCVVMLAASLYDRNFSSTLKLNNISNNNPTVTTI